jgi:hypothetical protein
MKTEKLFCGHGNQREEEMKTRKLAYVKEENEEEEEGKKYKKR